MRETRKLYSSSVSFPTSSERTLSVRNIPSGYSIYQLVPSVRPTGGTEYGSSPIGTEGLLPTPASQDANRNAAIGEGDEFVVQENGRVIKKNRNGGNVISAGIAKMAELGLLPTPTATERSHPERVEALKEAGAETMASRLNGANRPNGLTDRLMFDGLIPTVTATAATRGGQMVSGRTKTRPSGVTFASNINDLAKSDLLPTPRANKVSNLNLNSETLAKRGHGNLEEKIAGLWQEGQFLSTPVAGSWKEGVMSDIKGGIPRMELNHHISRMNGRCSQLNPRFVAEMMNFPVDYLVSPFLSGDRRP